MLTRGSWLGDIYWVIQWRTKREEKVNIIGGFRLVKKHDRKRNGKVNYCHFKSYNTINIINRNISWSWFILQLKGALFIFIFLAKFFLIYVEGGRETYASDLKKGLKKRTIRSKSSNHVIEHFVKW